jgi:pimeloyl-ACP methyl ester carboxylesterase
MVKANIRRHAFIQRTFDALRQPAQALSLQNRLGQLTMPVLGLWCHDDRIVDISAMDSLRAGLTHASAISSTMLNGCGHMPMLEKPQETAQALTAFALSH